MADDETRKLLHEIDSNDVIREYLKAACHDIHSILQSMSLYMCFKGGASGGHNPMPPAVPGRDGCRNYKYNQTMHFLMNLGTMQNTTHAGSVRICDIGSVFLDGNARERCTMLMNIMCHDKKYCIMQWLLLRANEECMAHVDTLEMKVNKADTYVDRCAPESGIGALPASVDVSRLMAYKNVLGICSAASVSFLDLDVAGKKDMRKVLCRIINRPRKNTRTTRPLCTQKAYSLASNDAILALSWREWTLL